MASTEKIAEQAKKHQGIQRPRSSFILKMESTNDGSVVGIPVNSLTFAAAQLPKHPPSHGKHKKDSIVQWMSKLGEKAEGIREHVTLGPKISETMKGKLSMGARILQAGGVERVFRRAFAAAEGEKLLKVFQCYLSTTAGPISGTLFVSSEKVAFRSNRSLKLRSGKGSLVRVPYKVLIPLRKICGAVESESTSRPSQKYIQIVTEDDFEFWFMGFVSSERSFRCLQQAIAASQSA